MGGKLFRILLTIAVFAVVIVIAFCVYGSSGQTVTETKHMFSEEEVSREILFDGNHIFTTKDSFIRIEDKVVTITRSGTYLLKGDLEDGQIIVNVGKDEEVKLKMNGLSVSCSFGPAIFVKQAKKVRIRLKSGSENVLSDGTGTETTASWTNSRNSRSDSDNSAAKEENSKIDDSWRGCIYARSDLNIKGDGVLIVHGNHRHGIFSSKDLKIKSGTVTVDAVRQTLHGKKSVIIEDGNITLKAGTDGIHSNGILDILGGSVNIDAGKYGMYAFSRLHVNRASDKPQKKGLGTDTAADGREGARVNIEHALSEAGCQGEMEY